MAIKLAELGVSEVITLLKADLSGKLTAIDTDRGDLTLAVPASADYYDYPRQVVAGTLHVEVFESDIVFEHFYSDVAIPRITYELNLTIRLTYFNRDGDTPSQMVNRGRRYAVGILDVFKDKPTLGGADEHIQVVNLTSAEPQWITEGEDTDHIAKANVTVAITLKCEET